MLLFRQKAALKDYLQRQRTADEKIGFIPTMGALHAGHLSLIKAARDKAANVVSSIFVNPTQFDDKQDFEKYPAALEKDILLLSDTGTDVLFLPSVAEMYPEGTAAFPRYDFGYLETVLEGKFRPGHFQGVAQIVHRLLETVMPDYLFLGQKDFQQCMIIKRLVELTQLPVELIICPTLREPDGLAMSSRNLRLNTAEREKASLLSRSLQYIKDHIRQLSFPALKENAAKKLEEAGFTVDYVEIACADNLQLLQALPEKGKIVVLAAARIGRIRLIDNEVIDIPEIRDQV